MTTRLADHLATLELCRAGLAALGAGVVPTDHLQEIAACLRERDELRAALQAAIAEYRELCEEHALLLGALGMAGLSIRSDGRRYDYLWEALPSLPMGPSGAGYRSYAAAVTEALIAVRRQGDKVIR